jgi:GNAT superfamily N-acetyltransferase
MGNPLAIEIVEETSTALVDYSRISIAFQVSEIVDVAASATGSGFSMSETALSLPYVKDYDAIAGEGPCQWPQRFDLSNWGLLAAHLGGQRLGGAAVAFDTPGLDMLEGRCDLAVLWDIRVAPEARGRGIGALLFRAAEGWARARGCRVLKIETQNTNAPACRFYARQGCALGAIRPFAYPQFPNEVQMLWQKDLFPQSD